VANLRYGGAEVACGEGETVLDALERAGVDPAFSCRNGVCLTCMLRAREGTVPEAAQAGIKPALAAQGHFLPCVCTPSGDLVLEAPDDALTFGRAVVTAVERLAPAICRVRLAPATPLYYRAGQFINLRRGDGLVRSYSLASVPRLDEDLELHVKWLPGGRMSNWICDQLGAGEAVDVQGPNGAWFYLAGEPERPLLLIGNGSGLAPLMGIARDALADGHRGPIHLYHGSRNAAGLYLQEELRRLEAESGNFHYLPCLSGDDPDQARAGRAEEVALADHPDLAGWRVYLCGYPPMVEAAKKRAYLSGAALADIHADPFELQDLRRLPRD
jgi:NAD(P)H-flavin reductase